jgi:hypothetical protein
MNTEHSSKKLLHARSQTAPRYSPFARVKEVRLYSKVSLRVLKRGLHGIIRYGRQYFRMRRLGLASKGDERTQAFEALIKNWTAETLPRGYSAITGEERCDWRPHPNRKFVDVKEYPATHIERAWIDAVVQFDRCMADIEERMEESALTDIRAAKKLVHQLRQKMLKMPWGELPLLLLEKTPGELSTESVNNLVETVVDRA